MPLDSVCLWALREELEPVLVGMRIDKIQQPEKDELIFSLRGPEGNVKLLLCAGTGSARVHITQERYENPVSPPMFCMFLRKHIAGAKICSLTQPGLERLLDFELDTYDAMGVPCKKHLIIELMGRYANLILTEESGLVLDCMKRLDGEMGQVRPILPGLFYRPPEKQNKKEPLEVQEGEFFALLSQAAPEKLMDKWLLDTFLGFSPLICREIVYRAYHTTDKRVFEAEREDGFQAFARVFFALVSDMVEKRFSPCLLLDESGLPKEFSYTDIGQYGSLYERKKPGSFSELLELYYTKRHKAERMHQRAQALIKNTRNMRDRTARKLALQREELKSTANREILRECGDLITANLYRMKKGEAVLYAQDFYAEGGGERAIKLDPLKTPQQNAAKYYKEYTKAKNAEKYLTEQIEKGEKELDYLNSVLEEIERAEGERDLAEIRQELLDTGYIRPVKNSRKEKRTEQKPMRFRSSSGFEILVGKNNMQNDKLTLKTAFKSDLWLHAQKIHGSHVIISCERGEPDSQTIREAAMLAAFYSQARHSQNVPVDYTKVKYVKKPAGGKPGMVIYTDYKTLFVTPDEKIVDKLSV